MGRIRPILRGLLLLGVLAGPLFAGDEWSDPFLGVRYLHRTTDNPKLDMHLAFIDLTEPGIRLTATPPEDRRTVVSSFARKKKVQIAINGDFFDIGKTYKTVGLAIGEGKVWPDSAVDPNNWALLAAGGNRVEIYPPELEVKPEPWMRDAVGGNIMLLRDGAPFQDWEQRHPRTAGALTKDKRTLILLVADGRQAHSIGMTGTEMQKVFLEFGAWSALNFDGGGSSTMYIDGRGTVNKPSDGRERVDGNHLGVYAAPGASRPKGQIRGFVKEKGTGKPLPNAKVALSSAYFDVTHANGFFHFSQVPVATVQLSATLDGYDPVRVKVKVEARKTAEVAIEMTPKPPPPEKSTPTVSAPSAGAAGAAPSAPSASGGDDAGRLMTKARSYQNGRMWGKALDAYRKVETDFPGTSEAAAAKEEIDKLEAILAEPASR